MAGKIVYFPPINKSAEFDRWREWLESNGIPLKHVARDSPVWIIDGLQIEVVVFGVDERGSRLMHNPDCDCEYGNGGHYARRRQTYQLTVPLGPWADGGYDDDSMARV
jgi:hypothetical protein